jgi:hypothetical protein
MAAITLEDVNKSLQKQTEILDDDGKFSAMVAGKTHAHLETLNSSVSSLLGIFKSKFEGDDIEAAREGKPDVIPQSAAAGGKGGDGGFDFLAFGKGLLAGLLAAIPAIIAGLVGAVVASFNEFANDLARTLAAKKIFNFLKISDKVRDIIKTGLTGLIAGLKTALFSAMYLGQDGKPIAKVFKGIQGAQGAGPFAKALRGIKSIVELVGKVFSPIVKLVSGPTGKLLSGLGKVMGTLGTVLRTIFLPIGILFTAYDTIKGAVEGFQKDGPFGAITGGLGGLLGSIIGAPIDLLLSAVDWIAKKLGWSEDLIPDNFNVQKLIQDFFSNIPTLVKQAFSYIGDAIENFEFGIPDLKFGNPFENITEKIKNLDLTSLNFPKIGDFFGIDMNLGDKLKGALLQLFGGVGTGPLASLGTDDEDPFVESSQPSTATTLREGGDEMRRGRGAILNTGPPVSVIDASSRINSSQQTAMSIPTTAMDHSDPYMTPALT